VLRTLATVVFAVQALAQGPASQPNQHIFVPRPDAPPHNQYNFEAVEQEFTGKTRHLQGKAKIETDTMLLEADQIDFDQDTHDLRAEGNVHYHNFQRNEQLWAERVVYNTESETGTFYKVRGEASARIDTRPGRLTSNEPFFFQGEWAERLEDRYILHNGFITNCKMPNPWWKLTGPKFDIIPGERAKAYHSIFWVRVIPLFFTPYFYKSLEKVPRKSGFLVPSFGNSSLAGPFFDAGYFWAINRSYDVTYRFTEYFERAENHHAEFRAKPRPGTDFDAILTGVEDRGIHQPSGPPVTFSGITLTANARSDLGNGWNFIGQLNYISSFRFRQEWSAYSFNAAVFSEVPSVGYLNKNWSNYTFNVVAAHLENFQTAEIPITNPTTQAVTLASDAIVIRKLPEAEWSGREQQLWQNVPLWFSFDSSAGLLSRSEPLYDCGLCASPPYPNNILVERFQTSALMERVDLAPHLTTALHWGDFHIIPRFGVDETYYSESQVLSSSATQALGMPTYQVVGTNLLRSARDVSVDVIFPSLARVFSKKTIFGDKLKHVIEPRVTYNYVTGIGNDFNRFILFDPLELLSNTNELTLSLTNRVYAKRGDSVEELFTWELFQKRFFDPTFGGALVPGQANTFLSTAELTPYSFLTGPRSYSPVVSMLHTRPIGGLGIDWETDYDPRYGKFTDSAVTLDYHWAKYYFVSGGRNFVSTNPVLSAPANQYRFGAGYGNFNHKGWNAAVTGIYDSLKGVLQYLTAQVTYNTDCCGVSVEWRLINIGTQNGNVYIPVRDQSEFRISFSVANLGSVGNLRRQDRIF
jgi:LPS-assembly protein